MKKIHEVSQSDYFARDEVSNSMMKDFRQCGAWTYFHKYVDSSLPETKVSDSMRIGSALHAMICDSHLDIIAGKGESSIAITPSFIGTGSNMENINLRKKDHRLYMDEWKKKHEGKIFINSEEFNQILGMKASVSHNPATKEYIDRLTPDRSEVVATNKIKGVDCKAMCDADFSDEGLIIDFKTTRQHLGIEFARDAIFKFGYQYQAAHYCDVFEAERFIFIAIRNFPPYESIAFEMPKHMIDQARLINYDTLERIKWCHNMNDWHTDGWGQVVDLGELIENR